MNENPWLVKESDVSNAVFRLIATPSGVKIVPATALTQEPPGREEPSRRPEFYPASPAVDPLREDA